jgi:hypothetical protein
MDGLVRTVTHDHLTTGAAGQEQIKGTKPHGWEVENAGEGAASLGVMMMEGPVEMRVTREIAMGL